MPAEEDAALPAEDGRDADARLERHQWAELPKPFSPRSLAGSSVTSTGSRRRDRDDDELRDPHPRLDDERLLAVGVEEHDLELAAIAGVDEARRVHDRDAVPRREPRARLDEAGVAVGDRDREAGADDGARSRRELDPLAGGEVEARVAGVRARRQRRLVVEALDGQLASLRPSDAAFAAAASATR